MGGLAISFFFFALLNLDFLKKFFLIELIDFIIQHLIGGNT
jgi:hypothetical protein